MNFCFIITEKCNWSCRYCFFPEIENQKQPKLEILEKHLPYIKDFSMDGFLEWKGIKYMDVQGGEIGLVPVDILEYFFTTIGQKMYVSTNGVFLNNNFHKNEKIRPFIEIVQWHVFPDPSGAYLVQDMIDNGIFISKGIVHHDIDQMIDFINYNKYIMFHYIDFEYPIHIKLNHDREKYRELYNKILPIENLTKDAKNRIFKRINEWDQWRDICRKYNDSIMIDLVNEKICLCQRNLHINVDLNEENLKRRFKVAPIDFFDLSGTTCESCGRLYEGKTRRLQRV
jgi:hypothetical protein